MKRKMCALSDRCEGQSDEMCLHLGCQGKGWKLKQDQVCGLEDWIAADPRRCRASTWEEIRGMVQAILQAEKQLGGCEGINSKGSPSPEGAGIIVVS